MSRKLWIVALLFVFAGVMDAQGQTKGGVVPPPPPKPLTAQQRELDEAETNLFAAKTRLALAKDENAETIARYRNLKKDHVSAVKARRKAEERYLVFSAEMFIAPYDTDGGVVTKKTAVPDPLDPTDPMDPTAGTTKTIVVPKGGMAVVRSKLEEAKDNLDVAEANLKTSRATISVAALNPTTEEAKLINAYNKAKEKWEAIKRYAQQLRMLVSKGPADKTEHDEYARFRYRLEAPDNWTPEMILTEVYKNALEYESKIAESIEELQEAYDVAVKAIEEAEEYLEECREARDSLLQVLEIRSIKEEIQNGQKAIKGGLGEIKTEIHGVKDSIDALAGKLDTLTTTITAKQIAYLEQAEILAKMLNKIEALQARNMLTEQSLANLQQAQALASCPRPGQVCYSVCKRGRCWTVAM